MTLMKHSLCVPWLSMCAMTPYVYHEYCMLPVQWEMHTGNIDRQWLKCLKTQNFFWILFPEFWFISLFAGTVCATTCVHAGLLSGKGTTPICWYVFAASRSADHSWWVEFFSLKEYNHNCIAPPPLPTPLPLSPSPLLSLTGPLSRDLSS